MLVEDLRHRRRGFVRAVPRVGVNGVLTIQGRVYVVPTPEIAGKTQPRATARIDVHRATGETERYLVDEHGTWRGR